MAYDHDGWCSVCEKETSHTDNRCRRCTERDKKAKEEAWQAQTDTEKLNDLHERIKKIESWGTPFR